MSTRDFLIDFHQRVQRSFQKLLNHCSTLTEEELNRSIEGFGYPTVRLQIHHVLGAQKYWIGVLEGRIDAEEDDHLYPSFDSLKAYREEIDELVTQHLSDTTDEELLTPRTMLTWQNREKVLTPAHVIVRTYTHMFHHQGQILAMCRLMGKPNSGMDYPIE